MHPFGRSCHLTTPLPRGEPRGLPRQATVERDLFDELAFRVDHSKFSNHAFVRFVSKSKSYEGATAYWAGVNWLLNNSVKLSVDFAYSSLDTVVESLPDSEIAVLARSQLSF